MKITLLRTENISQIKIFIKKQYVTISKSFFFIPSNNIILRCLHEETGISHGAFIDDELVGVRLAYIPGIQKENHGYNLNFSKNELYNVVQFHGTLVERMIRSKGLGQQLVNINCEHIFARKLKHVLATVHPDNIMSITMFSRNNFRLVAFKNKYCNLPRYIYHRQKYYDNLSSSNEIRTLSLSNKEKIIEYLHSGFYGTSVFKVNGESFLTMDKY